MSDNTVKRAVAGTLVHVLEERPKIWRVMDEEEQHHVDVASFVDRPGAGWTTHSTVNLHEVQNTLNGQDVRVELIGVCRSGVEWFADMLGSVGFFMMKNGMVAAPGRVFPEIIRSYYDPGTRLPHVYLTAPIEHDALGGVQVSDSLRVHWLSAVPISDSEYAYLREHGDEAFEDMLEARDVDYADVERPSAV